MVVADIGLDQPADGAPPVPLLGQRAVDARRGDLEDVGTGERRAARRVAVECVGDRAADVGDRVEVDPAVGVDDDADQAAPTRGGDGEVLEVVSGGADDGVEHLHQVLSCLRGRGGPGRRHDQDSLRYFGCGYVLGVCGSACRVEPIGSGRLAVPWTSAPSRTARCRRPRRRGGASWSPAVSLWCRPAPACGGRRRDDGGEPAPSGGHPRARRRGRGRTRAHRPHRRPDPAFRRGAAATLAAIRRDHVNHYSAIRAGHRRRELSAPAAHPPGRHPYRLEAEARRPAGQRAAGRRGRRHASPAVDRSLGSPARQHRCVRSRARRGAAVTARLDPAVLAAWQDALAAEQQASWGYPLLGPRLPGDRQDRARACQARPRAGAQRHRGRDCRRRWRRRERRWATIPRCTGWPRWPWRSGSRTTAPPLGATSTPRRPRPPATLGAAGHRAAPADRQCLRAARWQLLAGTPHPVVAFPGTAPPK